jgi:hypothetical protein
VDRAFRLIQALRVDRLRDHECYRADLVRGATEVAKRLEVDSVLVPGKRDDRNILASTATSSNFAKKNW